MHGAAPAAPPELEQVSRDGETDKRRAAPQRRRRRAATSSAARGLRETAEQTRHSRPRPLSSGSAAVEI